MREETPSSRTKATIRLARHGPPHRGSVVDVKRFEGCVIRPVASAIGFIRHDLRHDRVDAVDRRGVVRGDQAKADHSVSEALTTMTKLKSGGAPELETGLKSSNPFGNREKCKLSSVAVGAVAYRKRI